jgi:CheY-like chemotaxis protein
MEMRLLRKHILPEMNGYEVVGRLKHDTRTHKIPLIIISAFSVDKSRLEQDMHSAFPVIKKPFEREVLLNHIYEMLTK